ncbi:cysteine hydrolase family protein [Mesorhizobium captivum]|uniref:cysteine hydrolase family protein n=1 Tax=Mesorhizobium captivum TaxID=3072319 RepID=UPI002A245327|nr:isochorismatase family cysteine hydrolase [Mesorhizobium sp. VK3C]MDX8449963.1 isochorismatase family cysteine hydrolase [Mesorhizobium sp. VK3C]
MTSSSIPSNAVHICVDMQRMFMPPNPWAVGWFPETLPKVIELVQRKPASTIFTRFIPARRPGEGQGQWRDYYCHWADMTLERAGREIVDLAPELQAFVPPARLFDKFVYSPWFDGSLQRALVAEAVDTVIVSGGEADMCVLATLLGAIDFGYRTILVEDAICSTSDEAYDNIVKLFSDRYSQQVEVTSVEAVLEFWR